MGDEYEKIEKVGSEIYVWHKGILSKERFLYGEMIELLLESVKPLGGYSKEMAYDEMALLTLATRLFNNAEGAKYLFLRELPDQAQRVFRDIIECFMLFRLFLKNLKLAERWLLESKEYQPGTVDAKLSQIGINANEEKIFDNVLLDTPFQSWRNKKIRIKGK